LMVLYKNYLQTMSQLDTLQSAVKKAEEGYHLNLKDYQFGQVTNLDVLSSLNLFIETKRAYNTLTTSAHLIYNNLEASTGVLP